MKRFLLLQFILISALVVHAQHRHQDQAKLDVNDWEVRFNSSGSHGWQWDTLLDFSFKPKAQTIIPKGSNKASLFAFSPWLAGKNPSGEIVSCATKYNQNGVDFIGGPLTKDTQALTDSSRLKYWDRVFKLNQWELSQFDSNGTVSQSLYSWPVSGNQGFNEPMHIAPFVDVNKDGFYDITSGDKPAMKGDQMVWLVQNDDLVKGLSRSATMQIELQTTGFAFTCADNDILNRTFFVEYQVINKSQYRYDSVKIGQWVDFDLGNPFDDHVGSDSVLGCFFVYNGDSIDEGNEGYGTNHPIISITSLKNTMSGFTYYNNDFQHNGNPRTRPDDYYNYLNARWKDGSSMHARDVSFATNRGHKTKYMFNGNPFDSNGFGELALGSDLGDRRGVGYTGPFTLNSGDTLKSLWAFTFHRAASGTREDAYKLMLKEVPEIKKLYTKTGLNSPCKSAIGVNVGETAESGISFYPNPAKNYVQIESDQPIDLVRILSIDGRMLRVLESNGNTVDVSSLQSGLYLLEFSTPLGKSMHRLVIE